MLCSAFQQSFAEEWASLTKPQRTGFHLSCLKKPHCSMQDFSQGIRSAESDQSEALGKSPGPQPFTEIHRNLGTFFKLSCRTLWSNTSCSAAATTMTPASPAFASWPHNFHMQMFANSALVDSVQKGHFTWELLSHNRYHFVWRPLCVCRHRGINGHHAIVCCQKGDGRVPW